MCVCLYVVHIVYFNEVKQNLNDIFVWPFNLSIIKFLCKNSIKNHHQIQRRTQDSIYGIATDNFWTMIEKM